MPAPPVRALTLVLPGEPLACVTGHTVAEPIAPPAGGARGAASPRAAPQLCQCRARAAGGAPCGRWLWVYPHGDGARTVVHLDAADVGAIHHARLTLPQLRDYLGLGWR